MPRQLWIIVQFTSDQSDENPPQIVAGPMPEDQVNAATRDLPQGTYDIMRAETAWSARVETRPSKVKRARAA
jgi:hypothetical protein